MKKKMMMEEHKLHTLLVERLQAKGFSLEKLREETDISDRYLAALFEGSYDKLPAAPYVRGYVYKLAPLLGLDGDHLWTLYTQEAHMKRSGSSDALPSNRFAFERINKKLFVGSILVVALVGYGLFHIDTFLGRAEITITQPQSETLVTTANTIVLSGVIDARDKLTIDGEQIVVTPRGEFQYTYVLSPGLNRIEFAVKKLIGGETTVVRNVIYQP